VPKEWFTERDRCRAAGIGDEVEFATKPDLGLRMIGRALAAGVPFCVGDRRRGLWAGGAVTVRLEGHEISHVLAVPKSHVVVRLDYFCHEQLPFYLGLGHIKAAVIAQGIHARHVQRMTVGAGFETVGALLAAAGLAVSAEA
jgi:hypothetical protein